jgi:hypothetical protein
MKIETTTEQIDIICKVAITLKRSPYTYTDNGVFFVTSEGKIVIDFKLKEMQFVDWAYNDEEIELQLLGICHMYQLLEQDYTE